MQAGGDGSVIFEALEKCNIGDEEEKEREMQTELGSS